MGNVVGAAQPSIEIRNGPKILYVAGWGRSGSTLVMRLLEKTGRAVGAGELINLWDSSVAEQKCQCGAQVRDCAFWACVVERAFGSGAADALVRGRELRHEVVRIRRMPQLLASRASDALAPSITEFAELVARVYRALAEVSGRPVVVDISKSPALCAGVGIGASTDLRILHMVRDPHAVAFSWSRTRHHGNGSVTALRYGLLKSSADWDMRNVLAQLCGTRLPYLRIRYEDLIAEPSNSLARVGAMLDEDLGDLALVTAGSVDLPGGHALGGNPMRYQVGPNSFRLDDEWRTAMPRWRHAVATALCGPLWYGYSARARRGSVHCSGADVLLAAAAIEAVI